MAKNKTAANVAPDANAGTEASGVADSTSKPRVKPNPENTIYWDGARDTALLTILMNNNGQLSAKQVLQQLSTSPAFAGEVHLLAHDGAAEKVRQRVRKLAQDAKEMGLGALALRRASNASYDRKATVQAVFAAAGKMVSAPTAPAPATAPTTPTLPGGLIPTA